MKIGKKIITIILALAVFAGTVLLESNITATATEVLLARIEIIPSQGGVQLVRDGNPYALKESAEFIAGDIVETPTGQTAIIRFSGNGVIRVASESKLVFIAGDTENDNFAFRLDKGRAWINTKYTSANFNILAGGALLIPRKAAFDVVYDGSKTVIRVNANQVGVGLVNPDFKQESVIRFNTSSFINSYLVAQGSQTTVYLEKILTSADTLKKLLYSKLIKEFQYALYDKEEFSDDPWFKQSVDLDSELAQKVAADKLKTINARGLKIAALDSIGYQLQKVAGRLADVLTFSEEKINERVVNSIFDQLYDAEYLLVFGRSTEAKERLELFRQLVDESMQNQDDDFKKMVMGDLRLAYAELIYVLPDDPLFEVKNTVSDVISGQLGESDDDIMEKFDLVRDYINYAYRLADSNALLSRMTLEQYFTRLADMMAKEKTKIIAMKNLIAEENQIVDNLLKQFPTFYQDRFFDKKYALENAWLALLPEGNDKNEEKQTIISTKIDFLKQLQYFFLNEKVALKDANLIALRLINEINDLQTGAAVGVSQLFALRLKDYGQFLRFLKTAELGALRGLTMKDKYQEFLAMQREQVSIEEAIKEFIGGQPVTAPVVLSSEQILNQVKSDFAGAGITDLLLGDFSGAEQHQIPVINAKLENVVFQGQYDWDKKLISQVLIGTTVVSRQPIRLENLSLILKPKEPEKPAVQVTLETQEIVTVSKAERVAKILLIQKLKGRGIGAAEADIAVKNMADGLFTVRKAALVDKTEVKISFEFKNKENLAFSVVVSTAAGDKRLEGDINLSDLSAKALEIYQGST